MKLPPLADFAVREPHTYCHARIQEEDIDLSIVAEDGTPSTMAYEFLILAIKDLNEISTIGNLYIKVFPDVAKSEIGTNLQTVGLTVDNRQGQLILRHEINYQSDLYGLWHVDFVLDSRQNTWSPVGFGRKSW